MAIGDTLGEVIRSDNFSEMFGGNFIIVRVAIDISQPLCRGRAISFGDNAEGFVSFKYERLPNLCYWCGMFSHEDKDCSLWLRNKGSLKVNDQQFGQWIRATQFNPLRKTVVVVKGFGNNASRCHQGSLSSSIISKVSPGEPSFSVKPVSESVASVGICASADSEKMMELSSVEVGQLSGRKIWERS